MTSGGAVKAPPGQTLVLLVISIFLAACNAHQEKPHVRARKVGVTTVQSKTVTLAEPYSCQITSHHRIEIRAPKQGYVGPISVRDGQSVKRGDLLLQLTRRWDKGAENKQDVEFINAPFDGIIGRLPQQGDFVEKSAALTTLSDNSLMQVYFSVPEAHYLEYKSANLDQHKDDLKIELVLADGKKFDQFGKLSAIGTEFHAGTVAFRADFANPQRLLRHGQMGAVLLSRVHDDAILVPQRATFEVLNKRYVYVVDDTNVVHQREIDVDDEWDDQFVVTGVRVGEKIVLEGVGYIRAGETVEYEARQPKKDVANMTNQAK
jgi:membrane fusion protein, multidrug efflux system